MRPELWMHKCCICGSQNDLDQGFPTTYYMWHYMDYMQSYSIFYKGYAKTAFTQVLYYKGSNLIGYRVPGGFWVNFFHKKPPIQP